MNLIQLKDRFTLKIEGNDAVKFLNGLTTNNVNKQNLTYGAMLNNQGRFLYDFFTFLQNDAIFLDCFLPRIDEIIKKMNFYKLKSDVKITKADDIKIFSCLEEDVKEGFLDPRNKAMGKRIYSVNKDAKGDENSYHLKRIELKIAESEHDLTYEKSIINEFGFDNINAVDYEKGCYVGQELIARTHHLGQVRKKIYHLRSQNTQKIEKNCEISCQGKKIGLILSCAKNEDGFDYLSLIRQDEEKSELFANGQNLKIIS